MAQVRIEPLSDLAQQSDKHPLAVQSVPEGMNLGPLFLLIGLIFFLVPPVLLVLAWRWFRKNSESLVGWRRQCFSVAVVGSALNIAVGLVFFLVHNLALPAMGYPVHGTIPRSVSPSIFLAERIVEWTGAICSVGFFALAFAGKGKARIYIILAAFCNFYLWAGTL